MFNRHDSTNAIATETIKGPSLARGPAWIVGLILSIAGLALFFKAPGTPLGTGSFPDGAAAGNTFLGFEANAWTAWGTTPAGILVLIGAAQHVLAKTMSLITGVALGAAAIIAAIDGDVLGLAAANFWTIVGWAIASGILLVTALLPRVTHEREIMVTEGRLVTERDAARDQPIAAPAPAPVAYSGDDADQRIPAEQQGMRSEGLRRTYQPGQAGQNTDDEVAAAQRAQADRERLR